MVEAQGPGATERRQRIVAALRERIVDDTSRYRARLAQRTRDAIRRRGGDDPWAWLKAYVGAVLDRYRGAPFDWPYTDFEAAVGRGLAPPERAVI